MSKENYEALYKEMVERYNSITLATMRQSGELEAKRTEITRLTNEITRLQAELAAAQNNAQLLGDDYNNRSQSAGFEVQRLREKLRENGIDPE